MAYASDLERRITRRVGQAIADFGLIEEADRILVGVSGGKDSLTLLRVLDLLRRRSPVRYTLVAGTLDQGYAGYDTTALRAWYEANGYDYRIVRQEAYDLEGKLASGITLCAFCSRQRRGFLYALADEVGATKIALGHHADDLIETLLLNQFFGGKIRTMAPRRRSDDGRHVVIRPLAYVWEQDLADYAAEQRLPVTPCGCPMCGSAELQRKQVKWLLGDLEDRNPGVKETLLRAMANVHVDELLVPPAKLAAGRPQGRITRGAAARVVAASAAASTAAHHVGREPGRVRRAVATPAVAARTVATLETAGAVGAAGAAGAAGGAGAACRPSDRRRLALPLAPDVAHVPAASMPAAAPSGTPGAAAAGDA